MDELEQLAFNKKYQLNQETSSIAWRELQRFFAAGHAIYVAQDLDLINVAFEISEDNTQKIQNWMHANKIANVCDEQAKRWLQDNTCMWTVVVKPWVLVQTKPR
jgi:hypothetical protein